MSPNANVGKDITRQKDILKEYDRVVLCLRCFQSKRYQGTGQRCEGHLLCSGFPEGHHEEPAGFQLCRIRSISTAKGKTCDGHRWR